MGRYPGTFFLGTGTFSSSFGRAYGFIQYACLIVRVQKGTLEQKWLFLWAYLRRRAAHVCVPVFGPAAPNTD